MLGTWAVGSILVTLSGNSCETQKPSEGPNGSRPSAESPVPVHRTCLKYSKPSETDGTRLLLVCDVALGRCKDVHKRDPTLSRAPEGHHSVHGVRRAQNPESDFEDDEFVVYSPDQVKIKYVVQFSVEGDHLKDFHPAVDTSAEPGQPDTDQGGIQGPTLSPPDVFLYY